MTTDHGFPPPRKLPPEEESRSSLADWRAQWSAPAAAAVPEIPATVVDSRPCLACGYDLKGLSSSGNCPECNSPVIRSLRGNLLGYASLEYLKTLRQGCLIVELSFAASILLTALGLAAGIAGIGAFGNINLAGIGRASEIIASATEALAATIGLLGWWIFSSPDPGLVGEDTGTSARKILRIALIGSAVVALLKVSLIFVPGFSQALRSVATPATTGATPPPGSVGGTVNFGGISARIGGGASLWPAIILGAVGLLGAGLVITKFFASMLYLRAIVRRMPDPELEIEVKRFTWLGPLLYTVGIVLCGLGPLIAFVMNWMIVDKTRQRLGTLIDGHQDAVPTARPG